MLIVPGKPFRQHLEEVSDKAEGSLFHILSYCRCKFSGEFCALLNLCILESPFLKMNHFNSIRELLGTLNRGHRLLTEMFEQRKSLHYRYELALELMDGDEDVIKLLLSKNIIRQNGNLLELDDQFLKFFEEILEVNE